MCGGKKSRSARRGNATNSPGQKPTSPESLGIGETEPTDADQASRNRRKMAYPCFDRQLNSQRTEERCGGSAYKYGPGGCRRVPRLAQMRRLHRAVQELARDFVTYGSLLGKRPLRRLLPSRQSEGPHGPFWASAPGRDRG